MTQHPTKIVTAYGSFLQDFRKYDKTIMEYAGEPMDEVAGVIFTGGADISPHLYHAIADSSTYPDLKRDNIEVSLYNQARKANKKILGVCRGHQLINALEGGVLTQDLFHTYGHRISWCDESILERFFPDTVNSMHHQGYTVEQIASTLIPKAIEPITGIVEVAESLDGQIVSVQFHPEFMGKYSDSFFEFILDWMRR